MRTTNSNRAPKRTTKGIEPSAPLFQVRTGSFAAQQRRRHELFDSDPSCRLCGAPEETAAHILLACPCLRDQPRTSSSMAELLGLVQPSGGDLLRSGQLHKEPLAAVGTPVQADRVGIGRRNAPQASFDKSVHRNSH
ncbi:hypothetical protein HPB50_005246 [Hyalomma asiaticum]|uniref:Uncharacterized protein n=1 Tax=Hyalomma asiaticum TaxID=266040 RepID=A0ACB7SS11_HYAAI|nr:hypothetical protein HPB50_005246 [Hyalomma asiaticum]